MENLEKNHYMVSTGGELNQKVCLNINESINYCSNKNRPSIIFSENDGERYIDTCSKKNINSISFNLVMNLKKPLIKIINSNGVDFNKVYNDVEKRFKNGLIIIDLIEPSENRIFNNCLGKNVDVLHCFDSILSLKENELNKYTSIRVGYDGFINEESFLRDLIDKFGKLDGLGLFLTQHIVNNLSIENEKYFEEKGSKPENYIYPSVYFANSVIKISEKNFNKYVSDKACKYLGLSKQQLIEMYIEN